MTNNRDHVRLTSAGKECRRFSSSSQMDRSVGEPGWRGEQEPGEAEVNSRGRGRQTLQRRGSAGRLPDAAGRGATPDPRLC